MGRSAGRARRMSLDPNTVADTLGALLKYQDDVGAITPQIAAQLVAEARSDADKVVEARV